MEITNTINPIINKKSLDTLILVFIAEIGSFNSIIFPLSKLPSSRRFVLVIKGSLAQIKLILAILL
ncbi:hypothetical protein [Clostridium sp.]|uniref:hypothetical protein n=1 Tax=Clostridium sp. TaxID=1506 RepID=UPI0025BCA361|nr:hypothetical protein [Clostridium sp.]